MPQYVFNFYFPELDPERQNATVNTWGGHLGTALSRAWRELKRLPKYQGLKRLCPATIGIGIRPKRC